MANLEDALLTDLAHHKDLGVTANGNLATISGLANVKLALYHRLLTVPGALITRPEYGVGIKRFQNAIASLSKQRQIANLIGENYKRDPRVKEVLGVSILNSDDRPELVQIVVRADIAGYGETQMIFTPFGGP